jgi:hypothetical protein
MTQPAGKSTEADLARQKRLREALRANLKRRKSQARSRADQESDGAPKATTPDEADRPEDHI